jgi:PAT family beta-lactamase induction signal transducer AmpG|tara:strand:+ start:1108 stop:3219 length:2112 start_codon:yes stop_codon:yes gene_type:complete
MRPVHFLLVLVVFASVSGCLGGEGGGSESAGNYTVESTISAVELEAKSANYPDGETVEWSVDSSGFSETIEAAGGNVVGVLFSLTYGEDETSGGPVCTGGEANAPDTITGVATKGEWTLSEADQNPGSHDVNLTWYNASLLSGVIEGLTKSEIEAQLAFGEEALGTYNLAVTVDAEAFNGALCSNNDEGEEVATVVSLLVLDFAILNEDGEEAAALVVGDGSLPVFLFAGWIFPVAFLIGYVATKQRDRFHLDLDFGEPETEVGKGESSSDGETLVDSYRARVITLSALYVAQGVPWGFITVTMVTFLAAEGADAGDLAYLLTLGTAPWSFKFVWGPIIDRFQIPELGRRRPWILYAQTGMIALLITMLLVPDLTDNISLLGALFFVYNVFTALQDVSTDALAVDVLQSHEFERVNSYMFTAKSLGGVIGGAGLGTIIGTVGIKGAFLIQIPILVIIMMVPLFMRERPGEKRFPWDEGEAVEVAEDSQEGDEEIRDFAVILSNIRTAFSVRSAQLGIAVSLVISLAFILIPILPLLFLQELGWSQEEFNATKGGIILVVTMLGAMAGGELGRQFGGKSMLMFAALGASLTTLTWGMLDSMWGEGWFMMLVWIIHTFLWAIVSICAYSLMMRVTWAEVGGTQFTGYMAMMNLSAIIGYQLAPIFAARYDYQTIFYIAAVLETFVILAALLIDPEETDRTLNATT